MKIPNLFLLFFTTTFSLASQSNSDILRSVIQNDSAFQKSEYSNSKLVFPGVSEVDQKRRLKFYKEELSQLARINADSITNNERIDFELIRFIIQDRADEIAFRSYLVPLNAEGGWYTDFLLSADRTGITKEAIEHYVKRLQAFRQYAIQHISNMTEGIKTGRTAPYEILKGRENIVDNCIPLKAEDSPFFKPFLNLSSAEFSSLKKEALLAIDTSVTPAYRAFVDFWKNVYIPSSARQVGIASQPAGKAYYENRVRFFTTLPLTAEEVFQTGVREVERIRKEMEEVIIDSGFEGSFSEFLNFLRTDPQFYARTPEELLKDASFIAKKIDGKLPEFFGTLPRNPYGVSPVPAAIAPTYTAGRYSPGSLEGHRAGFYWVNTFNLPSRPLYALPALTLHEAVPGHHLQISLAQELEGVPEFRKNAYLSAYGEGWALYSEWLGEEMGIYSTPYERFGKLTYEMWRACRMVVDPGLHVKGWTRQQAIDYMANNTALSIHECTTEIDRYIGWPGQAVSYKIGELKIRELRATAEKELGENFNLREFHDLVLSQGAVPLFTLGRLVLEWISKVKTKHQPRK
jgi:uncharacterized protein (DUF885 family)